MGRRRREEIEDRSTRAGAAFCVFGAFNVTAGLTFLFQAGGLLAANPDATVPMGFLLESFGFIALALAFAAVAANWALVTVPSTLGIGYALTGVPFLANAVGRGGYGLTGEIGGGFLIASAFFAYYTGAAMVVTSWRRAVLPLGGQP